MRQMRLMVKRGTDQMNPFGPLEEAAMRSQFRRMYHDIGYEESLQVLREILKTGELLAEVLLEEVRKGNND